LKQVERDEADLVLEVPLSFEKGLVKENEAKLIYGTQRDQRCEREFRCGIPEIDHTGLQQAGANGMDTISTASVRKQQ
jgi:hypothetical protein